MSECKCFYPKLPPVMKNGSQESNYAPCDITPETTSEIIEI